MVDENGQWKYCVNELLKQEDNMIKDVPKEWNQFQKELVSFLEI
ncbi:hypothetical protein [Clostridium estertheticum]|nr:hypothetical protein [Clostridium estertheticum]